MTTKHAFRCKNCGRLLRSEEAGERSIPTSCPVCYKGVEFYANGAHVFQSENWEILANCKPERLKELGLDASEVEKHTPILREINLKKGVETCKQAVEALEKKRQYWESHKGEIVSKFDGLAKQLSGLDGQIASIDRQAEVGGYSDIHGWEKLINERDRIYQEMASLASLELSSREAAHAAHCEGKIKEHEMVLAGLAEPIRQNLKARISEQVKTKDRS